ncbi:MAG: hypothetical protein JWP89_5457 [Schlesneria sp.]|nr:hypothetical protein [Schlesneria sp.]
MRIVASASIEIGSPSLVHTMPFQIVHSDITNYVEKQWRTTFERTVYKWNPKFPDEVQVTEEEIEQKTPNPESIREVSVTSIKVSDAPVVVRQKIAELLPPPTDVAS